MKYQYTIQTDEPSADLTYHEGLVGYQRVAEPVSMSTSYRVDITPDEDGFHAHGDPRLDDPSAPVKIFVDYVSYHSTLVADPGSDFANDAWEAFQGRFTYRSKALEVMQRFENIFGSGRTLGAHVIQNYDGDWMQLITVAEEGTSDEMVQSYVDEFGAWWKNDFYHGTLTKITTTTFEDGTETVDETELESVYGYLVIDFDWEYIIEDLTYGHQIAREALEIVKPY